MRSMSGRIILIRMNIGWGVFMVIPRWRVTLRKEHSDLRYLERYG